MKARDRIDQLRGDAEGVCGAPHAPFEDCAHVEFARDRADVGVLAFERERRGASGDLQLVDLGERVEQLFGEPVGEVLLLFVPAHVYKGQYRDRVRRRVEGGCGGLRCGARRHLLSGRTRVPGEPEPLSHEVRQRREDEGGNDREQCWL